MSRILPPLRRPSSVLAVGAMLPVRTRLPVLLAKLPAMMLRRRRSGRQKQSRHDHPHVHLPQHAQPQFPFTVRRVRPCRKVSAAGPDALSLAGYVSTRPVRRRLICTPPHA